MAATTRTAVRFRAWFGAPLLLLLLSRPALAGDGRLGATPWFPVVNPAAPQETFDENTLGVIRVGEDGWRPNRGKYRSQLDRHDFFVTVGRTDLAEHQARSASTSRIVYWTGWASAATGALLFYAHASSGGFDPSIRTSLIFAGAGVVAIWVAGFITGPDVPADQAEEMALRYNDQLRLHIERAIGSEKPRPMQVFAPPALVPWTDGRSGGGLMVLATF